MKNSKELLPVLTILVCVSLSCTFLKDKFATAGEPAQEFSKVAKLASLEPKTPIVSPGAVAIRKLAEIDPAVSTFIGSVETTERGAMKKLIDAHPHQPPTDKKEQKAASVPTKPQSWGASAAYQKSRSPVALMMFQAGDMPLPGLGDGALVGMLAGQFKSMLSGVETGNFSKKDSRTETSEGTTTTMEFELGGNEDGSTTFGLGLRTESTKNGVKVSSEMQAKVEGNDCPNAEGQVQLTVKARLSARSGGAGYSQDLTIFIRIQVDDNANIAASTVDITQATSRGKNGQEVYVETGETIKFDGDFKNSTSSNQRVIQKTDNATASDVDDAWKSGQSAAYGAAIGVIVTAESTWKGGKCIQIQASSPGAVGPGSGTEIPVKVRHRKDGSEIAAKLESTLVGEASIDPELMPRTPGTLMYVAPGETGKTATIKLKATSRRGIANLDLTANTGTNSYRIEGGLDDWYTNTIVCDITKPFTLTGTHGIKVDFSGGLSGTYKYSGGPFSAQGSGTYEMSFPYGQGSNGQMVGRGPGSVKGAGKTYKGSGTESYSLMTVDGPCVDGPAE